MGFLLPLDLEPMLATPQDGLPAGDGWVYEPKWDGFRILAFRDGPAVELISRGARPMTRYFPELVPPFLALRSERFVLDGEAVIVSRDGLDFDALQQRIHPAESRIRLLSQQTPAWYIAFDLLAQGDQDLRKEPLSERRRRLEELLQGAASPLFMTPYTADKQTAADWFDRFEGAGLDGVIAKGAGQVYLPGKRGWVKVKHERTADCVVVGFRWSNDGSSLGSLLLGLFDDEGTLNYVGHTSAFSAAERKQVLAKLKPYRGESGLPTGRMPGGPSRWSRGRETEWESVRPELVCEVAYEKLQSGERFRHAARFLRWRPDKPPAECGFDQIFSAAQFDVASIFGGG
ncbi:MAG TPA: ATP-dependent DNA ligase [Candidatus Acidoferrales bacterium]|nr:ATP-dependent DNA ligase [Candidatus Acidoferrales bacterium]